MKKIIGILLCSLFWMMLGLAEKQFEVSILKAKSNFKIDTIITPALVLPKEPKSEIFEEDKNIIICSTAISPEFTGGLTALTSFLQSNIKYPEEAIDYNIEGTIYLGFSVDTTGEICDVKLKRGIGCGCDEEAIRVVKMMPKWKPGRQGGKPVRANYTLPVKFYFTPSTVDSIYTCVEQLPDFPTAYSDCIKFIQPNLNFPKGFDGEGKVYVNFVVNKDGSISDIKVLRSFCTGCSEEVVRVIKLMPKWIPGRMLGKIVRSRFTMPIKFQLK